ncbi:helix-turn-helix transcriptional regulator [Sutterella wadsworthensis]|jgi:putative transcriptional regulator|uniref:helix-turn-helix transcriptional regulator n=1 Tax=Sutterella wadsworthensis TaxID=40545 RepID=UPI001F10D7A1|nr:AlpA family phage regulatory protein [Sutterella wadsworthensis]
MMTQKMFFRAKEAQEHTALARSTFYAYIAQGLLPPPIKLGERASAWLVSEIVAVNKARILGKMNEEIKALVSSLVEARSRMEDDTDE